MAHGLTPADSMFTVRKPAWHGLGAVLSQRPGSLAEALHVSGLDWTVEQQPVCLASRPGEPIAGHRANVRSDTGTVLGLVSDDYTVVQNHEAFGFLAGLIGSELHFETAGSLWGGRQVWVLAELPDWVQIGGDAVRRFVLVATAHTGAQAVRALVTPVRVVCQNTLRAAIAGARDSYRVRHLGDPTARLHEARAVFSLTLDYHRQFAQLGDRLATQRIGERALRRVLGELYPDDTALGGRALANRRAARDAVMAVLSGGETVGNAPGSKWAAWNAIVECHDFGGRKRTPEGGFVRALEDPHGVKARVLELVQAA